MMDGTFDVVPIGTFNQLLVIYYICRLYGKGNTQFDQFKFDFRLIPLLFLYVFQVFPIIFVLMNKRTQKSYEAVFEFINVKIFDMGGTKMFITDYEKAMRNALK